MPEEQAMRASVGATLRVVRASRRKPGRSSRPRIAWLSAEGVIPSCNPDLGEAVRLRDGHEG